MLYSRTERGDLKELGVTLNRALAISVVLFAVTSSLSSGVAFAQVQTPCMLSAPESILGASLATTQHVRVYAKFCDKDTALYTSDVWLTSPSSVFIGTGHLTPDESVVDLGVFPAGSELVFSLYVHDTGMTFFSGDANRNPDGIAHALVATLPNGEHLVGFEDLLGGGDHSYDDIVLIVTAVPTPREVSVDIKPDSKSNVINIGSAGIVPVAIFSSPIFDATRVNPGTISLAAHSVKLTAKAIQSSCRVADVNDDGIPDLVCNVLTKQLMIDPGESIAVLEAETFTGEAIRGEDFVTVVGVRRNR